MKKTFIALFALAGVTQAAYVWNKGAGDFDATAWANKDNWTLTENTVWKELNGSTGPGTPSSEMWDRIIIDGAAHFTGIALQGWAAKISLTNGASIVGTNKVFSGSCDVNLGTGCTLTLVSQGGNYNNGTNTYTVADANALTLTMRHNSYGSANGVYNLGENGSITLIGSNSTAQTFGGTNTFNAILDSSTAGLNSRTLANITNLTLKDLAYNFEGWKASEVEITEENYMEHIGEYWVSTADNKITVYYAVPEPTTATLSLLALAALAARRRRK